MARLWQNLGVCATALLAFVCGYQSGTAEPVTTAVVAPAPESSSTAETIVPLAEVVLAKVESFLARQRVWIPPDESYAIARAVAEASRRYALEPELVLAVIETESSFDRTAVSHKGAVGLMQLLPSTARGVAAELDIEWTGETLLENPEMNIHLGTYYLSKLVALFGDRDAALIAYNMGPNRMADMRARQQPIPNGYRNRVIGAYEVFR